MANPLKASVSELNTGMQGLNAAIGGYAANMKKLNDGMEVTVPEASQGIDQLNAGFAQLGAAMMHYFKVQRNFSKIHRYS